MPAGGRAGGFEDGRDTAADQRNGAGRLIIGFGREQAEKAHFAIHAALRVIFLHADIVAGHPAVHEAHQRRFGNKDRIRLGQMRADLGRQNQGLGFRREHVEFLIAQNAQIGALDHDRLFGQHMPVRIRLELIFTAPQEHEMLAREPFQEGNSLVAVHVLQMGHALQAVDLLLHAGTHGLEICDGHSIVRERLTHPGLQPDGLFMCQNGQMDLNDRHAAAILQLDDRVEQRRHLESLRAAFAEHRIHEERHVGADGLKDGAGQGVALLPLDIQKDTDVLIARCDRLCPAPVSAREEF